MAMDLDAFLEKWKQGWDFRNNIDSIILKGRMKADLEEMMETPVRALRRSCEVLDMYRAKIKYMGLEDPLEEHIKALDTIMESIRAKEDRFCEGSK